MFLNNHGLKEIYLNRLIKLLMNLQNKLKSVLMKINWCKDLRIIIINTNITKKNNLKSAILITNKNFTGIF